MKSDFIWLDDKLVPYEEATVHVITPTLHYGVGVFEGIRCYQTPRGPAIFRLQDHLERFIESIHILGILDFSYSVEVIREAVYQTISANGFNECYIRPLMYLQGPLGLNMDQSDPKLSVAAWEWGPYLGDEAGRTGIHVMVSSFTRLHPNINMTKSKVTGNYANSMVIKTLALRSGYDEAVILDPNGYVAECTGENIFLVRDGVLYTPPRATILEGITRDTVMKLAADLNIPVVEELITRDQLYIADEVLITGTAAEIVGVRMIDFRQVGEGEIGPITRAISDSYRDTVIGKGLRSEEWLDYLPVHQAADQEKVLIDL
jgi:branched-chain amino acid aminotransferase